MLSILSRRAPRARDGTRVLIAVCCAEPLTIATLHLARLRVGGPMERRKRARRQSVMGDGRARRSRAADDFLPERLTVSSMPYRFGGGYAGRGLCGVRSRATLMPGIAALEARTCGFGPACRTAPARCRHWLDDSLRALRDPAALAICEHAAAPSHEIGASANRRRWIDVRVRSPATSRSRRAPPSRDAAPPALLPAERLGSAAEPGVALRPPRPRPRCASRRGSAAFSRGARRAGREAGLGLRSALLEDGAAIDEGTCARAARWLKLLRRRRKFTAGARSRRRSSWAINAAAAGSALRTGSWSPRRTCRSTSGCPTCSRRSAGRAASASRPHARTCTTSAPPPTAGSPSAGAAAGSPTERGWAAGSRPTTGSRSECGPTCSSSSQACADAGSTPPGAGPVDVSPNRLPVIGTLADGRAHYVYGFTGNGVGPAHLAGKILAGLALDARDELTGLALVEPAGSPVPPEPIRYIGGEPGSGRADQQGGPRGRRAHSDDAERARGRAAAPPRSPHRAVSGRRGVVAFGPGRARGR